MRFRRTHVAPGIWLLSLLLGCSQEGPSQSEPGTFLLDTAGATVLHNIDHPLFEVVGAVLVSDGIVIANGGAQELLFYDRQGHFRRAVGRRGGGPGEFQRLAWIQQVGSAIIVNDGLLGRVSEFTATGDFVRSVNVMPARGYPFVAAVGVFPDGSIVVAATRRMQAASREPLQFRDTTVVLRYSREGEFLDSLGSFLGGDTYAEPWGRGGQIYVAPPLGRGSAAAVHDGHYYVTNDSASAVLVYDTTGALVQQMPSEPLPPPVLTRIQLDRVRMRQASRFPKNVDVGGIAERIPVGPGAPPLGWAGERRLSIFRVGHDGSVWALQFGGVDPAPPVWAVVRPDGSVVGRVAADAELDVLDIDGDAVLVRRWDENDTEIVELRRVRW